MKSLISAIVLATSLPVYALPPIALQGMLGAASNSPCLPLTAAWAPQTGNLQNLWHLDDVSGTLTAADSIGGNTLNATARSAQIAEHLGRKSLTNNPNTTGLVASNLVADPASLTYTAWIKTSSFNGGGIVGFASSQNASPGDWDRILAMTSTGQLVFGFWDGTTRIIASPATYNDGSWHHVAVTYTVGAMALYVDGISVASATYGSALPYSGYFRIGTAHMAGWPGFPTSNSFDGLIDEVGIWSVALTAGEIAALAASPSEVNSSHPKWANTYGIYHFSETSGNFADSTSNANTALPYGTRPLTVAGFYGTGTIGVSGSIVNYTSTTQYNDPQVFTLMAWFKTNSPVGGVMIEFTGQQTGYPSNYDRFIAMEDSGQVVFGVNGGTSITRSPLGYKDANWHQAIATFTSGSQILYIDGVAVATASPSNAEPINGWWRLADGNLTGWSVTSSSTQYYGYLDEVAVWNSVLTPAEVLKVYRAQRCAN